MFTSLALLVYLADRVEPIAEVFCKTGAGLIICSACVIIIVLGCWCVGDLDDTEVVKPSMVKPTVKWSVIALVVGIAIIVVANMLPSKKAVYMIAGIQAAEYLVNTDTAKDIGNEGVKIFKDVGTIIHSYAVEAAGTVKETVTEGAKKAATTTSKVVEAVKDTATSVVKETIKETIKDK